MASIMGECTIMQKITHTEQAIETCYHRIESLENRMESKNVSAKTKNEISKELTEMRKLLEVNKQQLSQLHRHNMKSFMFVAAFCFICCTIYVLYILVQGKDF